MHGQNHIKFKLTRLEIIQIVAIITLNSDTWSLCTNRHGVLSETVSIFTNTVVRPAACTTLCCYLATNETFHPTLNQLQKSQQLATEILS